MSPGMSKRKEAKRRYSKGRGNVPGMNNVNNKIKVYGNISIAH